MANAIGKMAILLGWGGQPAEAGLARAKKGLEGTAAAAKNSSGPWQKLTESLKGFADVKAGFDLFTGFISKIKNGAAGILDLGGQLEQLQLRAAYLTGSFEKGSEAIESLRDVSVRSGIPLETLNKAFSELVTTGLSAKAVTSLLRDTASAVGVLGGGAAGAEKLASAFGALAHGATASEGTLQSLQSGGLKVFEALADRLTALTGKTYTAKDAMIALSRGTVLAGTAIQAIQDAANTPGANEAAQRFKNSYAGKLEEIKETATDTFREIGKALIDSFKITEALSGFKGFLFGIRDIVLEIGKQFSLLVDPLSKTGGIEASFKVARDFAYEFGESFSKGAVAFQEAIRIGVIQLEALIEKAGVAAQLGVTGFQTGDTQKVFEGIDLTTRLKISPIKKQAEDATQKIGNFFDNLKAKAASADQAAEAAKAAATAQAAQAAAAQQVAKAAEAAQAALELTSRNLKDWTRENLESTATPLESLKKDFQQLSELVGQAAQVGLGLTEEEIGKFQEAVARKASKSLSDFITANEGGGDTYGAGSAARGSAAAVEAVIRNQFGNEGKDIQTRIEQATIRNAVIAERQLQIQKAQLEALSRFPAPPAVIAFPKI